MALARNVETTADFAKRKDELARLGWYHSIELPDGSVIPGHQSIAQLRERLARFPIPRDLTGKRVLDIGCWDGWFSFEMERRGATVVAVDSTEQQTFSEAKKLLNSKVEYVIEDVFHLSPAAIGYFDIVLFFGVLYHLKHPLLALEKVCELTREMACIESFVIDDPPQPDAVPLAEFYERAELAGQFDNWSGPNTACLLAYCRTAGFVNPRLIGVWDYRAHVVAYRRWPEITRSGAAPELIYVENTSTHDHQFRNDRDHYFTVGFKTDRTGLTVENLAVRVGPFGVTPIDVCNVGGQGWQASCKLPPGLVHGWFHVTLAAGDSEWSRPSRIAVDLSREERRRQDAISDLHIAVVTDGTTFEWDTIHVGRGSAVTVWVEGLPADVLVNDVTLRLDGTDLPAVYISPPVTHAEYRQINALLPPSMRPDEYQIAVQWQGEESPPVSIRLVK